MTKTCARCQQDKPLEVFPKNDRMRSGYDSYCRPCRNELARAQRDKDKAGRPPSKRHTLTDVDPVTAVGTCSICGPHTKAWKGGGTERDRWRCANRISAQNSRRREEDPAAARERKWANNGLVDMTMDRFNAMLEEQRGLCALCERHMASPQVDHCHDTGTVRALLCSTCNTGLGKFGDDPDRLRAAAAYLRSYITKERQMAN